MLGDNVKEVVLISLGTLLMGMAIAIPAVFVIATLNLISKY